MQKETGNKPGDADDPHSPHTSLRGESILVISFVSSKKRVPLRGELWGMLFSWSLIVESIFDIRTSNLNLSYIN